MHSKNILFDMQNFDIYLHFFLGEFHLFHVSKEIETSIEHVCYLHMIHAG